MRAALSTFTKSERAELHELVGEVYEWELHQHLAELDKAFAQWRRAEMLSSELCEEIHQFHQHPARELWSMYQSLSEDEIVARGMALGALNFARLSPKLLAKIEPLSKRWRLARDHDA